MANPIAKGITRGVCAVLLAGAMVASAPALALATGFGFGGYGGYGGWGGYDWGGHDGGGHDGGGGCKSDCGGGGGGCTSDCGTQVPEPGTAALMGAGLAGVAIWFRRRERKA